MAVTSHVYPLAQSAIDDGTINLSSTAAGAFKAFLCTGSAAAWTATQWAFQFVSSATAAYTEVTGGGYARVSLTGITLTQNAGNKQIVNWNCTSPISFGSAVTITAASMFIYTTLVGTTDATFPLISVIDFGQNIVSTAGNWTYTVDGTNGLAYWNQN